MSPPLLLVLALASAILTGSARASQHAWGADPLADGSSQLEEEVPELGEEEPGNKTLIWPSDNRWCQCVGSECGCCFNMSAPRFGIKEKACTNLTYYPDQYALGFSISIDDNVVLNRTLSGRDPPPICWPEQLAQLCVRFYNMTYRRTEVDGCVRLEGVIAHEVIVSYNVGCYVLNDDAVKTRISGLRRFLVDAIRRRTRPDLWPEGVNDIYDRSET
ncbi:hypothetical protein HPB50_009302 [Hyalomma asiaticum]|uniref:Uncharacterized protein n=1 Tax=Hyalomma asiaticum TaxID=266040 RepID=A0ACB7THM0_HYAAI|nr:hypothetical protein HPB50_009302 [Hyalomma asiaticum]